MKKISYVIFVLFLIGILCFTMCACSIFGPPPLDRPDDGGNNNGNQNQDDDDDDNGDNGNKPQNPYLDIINLLLDNISDINSFGDFVQSLSFILTNLPVQNIKDKAKNLIGDEYHEIIDENFDKAMDMLNLASSLLPLLPNITIILGKIKENSGDPSFDLAVTIALKALGITKNGNTYTFEHDDGEKTTEYTLTIQEKEEEEEGNLYLISFDDKAFTLDIIDDNNYIVIENDIEYALSYRPDDKALTFDATDIQDAQLPVALYVFECILIDNIQETNFAMQLFDANSGKLAQLRTNIERLEAKISLQEDIAELPYSLLDGVPSSFADEGEVYIINEGLLAEYL